MDKPTLYLIDGNAILYRAYFAFIKTPLVNSKGMNTGALFGTANTILRFLDKSALEYILVSFDEKGPTFRHELSETYKANRPPMPDELIQQVEPVKQFFSLIEIPELSKSGFEADDVLATVATKLQDTYQVVIVTGDKDYSQLVNDNITLYDPFKDIAMNKDAVVEKYGVKPSQFIDYLALIGDTADNIPGVKGIGPKGAEALLQQYGDLDGIYAHIDEVKGSTQTKLIEGKDSAYLSRVLATIDCNVPVEIPNAQALRYRADKEQQLIPFLKEYELNSLTKKLEAKFPQQDDFFNDIPDLSVSSVNKKEGFSFEAKLIADWSEFEQLLPALRAASVVSIDTETTSVNPMQADLVGISLCWDEEIAYYLPVQHTMAANLPLHDCVNILQQALENALLVGHNLKYDLMVFANHGWDCHNQLFDTMVASYVLDPGEPRHSLDICVERELGHQMIPISDLIGSGKKQITFDLVEPEKAAVYSGEDANAALRLYHIYLKRLQDTGLYPLFMQIEMPLLPVLLQMEKNGVHIDSNKLAELSHKNQARVAELMAAIFQISGHPFNLNSTQQLAQVLFEELQLPVARKTKTGYSTDNEVLEGLGEYEIAKLLMEYRQLIKLENTYIKALPELVNPKTGRVHSSFNQTIASTGRLSSTNPNLQNIPIRTELGREIREAFNYSSADRVILAADYSQVELRLLAIMSQDPHLIKSFKDEADIHRQTAALMFGIDPSMVSTDQRRQAKTINFGILYGMGQVSLSKQLGISQKQAKEFIEKYFEQFPTIQAYIQHAKQLAKEKGYSETLFGRRLYLPFILSTNQRLSSEAERIAVNMPIQGTAADVMKLAMIDIQRKIATRTDVLMLIQVHDELVFEVQVEAIEELSSLIRLAMENALPSRYSDMVSLKVEIGIGKSWAEAH